MHESSGGEDEYERASLELYEPRAGSLHVVGTPVQLLAEVLDADGIPIEIDDVVWVSDQVDVALARSLQGEADLPIGIHEVRVIARLPDDERLEARAGGIRVQSPQAGIYVGESELRLELNFMDQMVYPSCIAGLAFTVDMSGERFVAQSGSCSLELLLTSFDLNYTLEAEIDGDVVRGTIRYDVGGLLYLPYDWEGELKDGMFSASYEGDILLPFVGSGYVSGGLSATRISAWVEP